MQLKLSISLSLPSDLQIPLVYSVAALNFFERCSENGIVFKVLESMHKSKTIDRCCIILIKLIYSLGMNGLVIR